MDVGNILSKSFKYPINDFKNFLKICILCVLPIIPLIAVLFFEDEMIITALGCIFAILLLVVFLVLPGYFISVIKQGSNVSNSIPSLKVGRNIINTLKWVVLNIIYSIIPIAVFAVCIVSSGIFSLFQADLIAENPDAVINVLSSLAIYLLIGLVVAWIFSLISSVATARFAKYDSLAEAFSFKALYRDIRKIGVLRIIGWFILINIVITFISNITSLVMFIPYVGVIIYLGFVVPYLVAVYYYSLGLLYSNAGGSVEYDDEYEDDGEELDLDEFEREIQALKMMR